MKILTLETSGKICGISILENNNLIKETILDNGLTHSETLMPLIQQTLKNIQLKINEIDLIICDKGPGSFTGIRIGVATAKALSDALNIKAIGVSSLEALCYNIEDPATICSLIDAKNGNCYYSIFENTGKDFIKIKEFNINNINNILDEIKSLDIKNNITFTGDGATNYKDKILETIPQSKFCDKELSPTKLALCGLNHLNTDNEETELLPMYLRKSQAEIVMEEKQNAENK